jgi:membrane-associated progesterone receptor component
MEAPNVVLNAPLDTPYTVAELATYNGQDPSRPIYVAMKGIIFDGAFTLLSQERRRS